jgi:hypothetical protein
MLVFFIPILGMIVPLLGMINLSTKAALCRATSWSKPDYIAEEAAVSPQYKGWQYVGIIEPSPITSVTPAKAG